MTGTENTRELKIIKDSVKIATGKKLYYCLFCNDLCADKKLKDYHLVYGHKNACKSFDLNKLVDVPVIIEKNLSTAKCYGKILLQKCMVIYDKQRGLSKKPKELPDELNQDSCLTTEMLIEGYRQQLISLRRVVKKTGKCTKKIWLRPMHRWMIPKTVLSSLQFG